MCQNSSEENKKKHSNNGNTVASKTMRRVKRGLDSRNIVLTECLDY